MDWSFMERFAPLYVQAAGLTLRIGSLGIALSLGVGLLCCLARYYRVPGLRQISRAYIELARNTPLLVQLFFLYFGLPKIGIKLSGEAWAGRTWPNPCAAAWRRWIAPSARRGNAWGLRARRTCAM